MYALSAVQTPGTGQNTERADCTQYETTSTTTHASRLASVASRMNGGAILAHTHTHYGFITLSHSHSHQGLHTPQSRARGEAGLRQGQGSFLLRNEGLVCKLPRPQASA